MRKENEMDIEVLLGSKGGFGDTKKLGLKA